MSTLKGATMKIFISWITFFHTAAILYGIVIPKSWKNGSCDIYVESIEATRNSGAVFQAPNHLAFTIRTYLPSQDLVEVGALENQMGEGAPAAAWRKRVASRMGDNEWRVLFPFPRDYTSKPMLAVFYVRTASNREYFLNKNAQPNSNFIIDYSLFYQAEGFSQSSGAKAVPTFPMAPPFTEQFNPQQCSTNEP
jgi:hypothetical protein